MKNSKLTPEEREARRQYMAEWRERNREHYNELCRKWREENPNAVRKHQSDFWSKKRNQ